MVLGTRHQGGSEPAPILQWGQSVLTSYTTHPPRKKPTPGEGMHPIPACVFSHATWQAELPTWKAQGNLWAAEG